MRTKRLLILLALLPVASPIPAQTYWYNKNDAAPARRATMGCAFDEARNEVILFGGMGKEPALADTWRWNGSTWQLLRPAHRPPPRYDFAMTYDSTRGRVLLFGGVSEFQTQPSNDTWEWDGADWTERLPATSPPRRRGAAMAHDPVRGRTVLFGGQGYQDTWEWDGVSWTQMTPATVPDRRFGQGLAFLPGRNRVVMSMGYLAQPIGETWEWDGVDWRARASFPVGGNRHYHGFTYSPAHGRLLLFGGEDHGGTVTYQDLWAFDGTSWSLLTTTNAPLQRSRHAFTRAPNQTCIVHGGTADFVNLLPDTWSMTAANAFSVYVPPVRWPSARYQHGLGYDYVNRGILMFGGTSNNAQAGAASNQTWLRDDQGWRQLFPAQSPQPRMAHAMTTDFQRDRVVVFGGADSLTGLLRDDTWEWDGTTWREILPATRPPGRLYSVLAFDSARNRTWLFGGYRTPNWLTDTWSWDGSTWLQHGTSPAPALVGLNGIYDALRGKVVVFGRTAAGSAETWTWDGTTWRLHATPAGLAGRGGHAMAFDPIRGRVILNGGGWAGLGKLSDTWEWDGTTWVQYSGVAPSAREWHRMTFDAARGMPFTFGGITDAGNAIDTFAYFAPQGSFFGAGSQGANTPTLLQQTLIGARLDVFCTVPAGAFGASLLLARTPALIPPLPLDPPLACSASQLHLLPEFVLPMAGATPRVAFPIPWDRGLEGLGLLLQVAYVEPASCLGLSHATAAVLWDQ